MIVNFDLLLFYWEFAIMAHKLKKKFCWVVLIFFKYARIYANIFPDIGMNIVYC